MVRDPDEQKPARPVAAPERKYSAKDREEADEANPGKVMFKRTLKVELGGVVGKSDYAGGYEQVTDDGD